MYRRITYELGRIVHLLIFGFSYYMSACFFDNLHVDFFIIPWGNEKQEQKCYNLKFQIYFK